nr:uncharacterized protein LOC113734391 [Coffea arabica]
MAQLQQETSALTMSTTQFQQDTKAGMKDMEARISQMATAINCLESHAYGKLPSQPEINSRNVSVVTLRSGKTLEGPKAGNSKSKSEEEIEKEIEEEGCVREDPKVGKDKEGREGKIALGCVSKSGEFPCWMQSNRYRNRTNAYPEGLVEDVLVQVNELVFPAYFCVIDMGDEKALNPSLILLGRPFLSTARTKIDVNEGILSMEFDGEIVNFNIFDAMKYSDEANSVFALSIIEPLVHDTFELNRGDALKVALAKHLELGATPDVELSDVLYCAVGALHSLPQIPSRHLSWNSSLSQSILKYAFLGDKETLAVIISAHLSPRQEDNLIRLLRDHKEAIGWNIADIKRISPSLCMHRIRLEENAKPVRQAQRRLNPLIMEVVKKEILKLLEVGIIFVISNSPWVNLVQVVSKKAGVTVEENQEGEIVPVRKPTGWRQCIDYRRQNAVTKKDHFSLSFIDQMLERLSGRVYYCFLDDFSVISRSR